MDAYLFQEAYQSLKVINLISSSSNSDGLLVGHRRGHRFFVEKILPSLPGFFPSLKKYHELDQFLNGKLLGFYSFNPEEEKIKKILAPFACGKLFLKISSNQQKKMTVKSYVIDYENEFFLLPLVLTSHE
ncbi:MAG: hypothetical protein GTO16_02970 [Candidatus Aminicenantes bacterium]|nr:hypothetical protein [Candidatus Aminicenantes bacterium]